MARLMHSFTFLVAVMTSLLAPGCDTLRSGSEPIPGGLPTALESVKYRFELTPAGPLAVRVSMTVMSRGESTSRLAIAPEWGGVRDCERFIHNLQVRDAAGKACTVKASGHGWDVEHEPDALLTATYDLRPGEGNPWDKFGTHYEPVLRDDLFCLIGNTGLIYPEWLEDSGPIDISLEWSGFRDRGWEIASSFPLDSDSADRISVNRPLPQFRHAMFMAGKLRTADRKVKGGNVRIALYGDDWPFSVDEMADLVARIVEMERDFVRDYGDPHFLVTIAPVGPRAHPEAVSMGGTGLTDCFALYMAPGSAIGETSPHRNRVLQLLAHEYFHTWNGGEIHVEEPEELVYWFSEGFTDFFAARMLLKAGLTSDDVWLDRMNESMQALWLSPAATAPASEIQKQFWTSSALRDLPYKRGDVVALCIDEEIRRASGGKKSIDDFFLEVLADGRRGSKVSTDSLIARLAEWTSPEFAAGIRRVVVDGALPDPPREITTPRAERIDQESYRWDAGLDVDASVKTRIVTGVKEGSAAHAAGLRDGMAIKGLNLHHGDPGKEVTLKVGDDKREIKYWPRGEGVKVVGYRKAG